MSPTRNPTRPASTTRPDQPVEVTADRSPARTPEFAAEVLASEAATIAGLAERARTIDAAAWSSAVDLLAATRNHVVVSGMGKSGLIGQKISATFSSLRQPSSFLHPAEAVHGDLGRLTSGDTVVLLSYSGETEDVVHLASILKADGLPRLAICKSADSSLGRLSDVTIPLGDIVEACPLNLAPTNSTTAQLAIGDALALALAERKGIDSDDFRRAHPGGKLGAQLRCVTEILRLRVGENLSVHEQSTPLRAILRAGAGNRRAGALLLVDADGRLAGVFTDADLRRGLAADTLDLDRPVQEVMTAGPKHLRHDQMVSDAERLVREHRVDEIPVVDSDGRPIGLLDVQDLIAMKIVLP